jgi:ribosome-associated heat shock protein Hsp15
MGTDKKRQGDANKAPDSEVERVRLDQWLWAARFYRTRAMAKNAIDGGKVQIGGVKAKASRAVHPGDVILMTRPFFHMEVKVTGLSANRGSATSAQTLYEESADSINARMRAIAARRLERAGLVPPAGRPEKHDRRELRRLKQSEPEG